MSEDFENETSKDIGVLIGEMKSVKDILQNHMRRQDDILVVIQNQGKEIQAQGKEIEKIKTTAKVIHTIMIFIAGVISWFSGIFSHYKSGQ